MLSFISAGVVLANDYDIDRRTVDGGGDMWTTGGDSELSGTIGQPDANAEVMTGGDYTLTGGFWGGGMPIAGGYKVYMPLVVR